METVVADKCYKIAILRKLKHNHVESTLPGRLPAPARDRPHYVNRDFVLFY